MLLLNKKQEYIHSHIPSLNNYLIISDTLLGYTVYLPVAFFLLTCHLQTSWAKGMDLRFAKSNLFDA